MYNIVHPQGRIYHMVRLENDAKDPRLKARNWRKIANFFHDNPKVSRVLRFVNSTLIVYQ